MTSDIKSITLATAKDKIDAPDGKVAAAYKLARAKKSSGRLNLSDIRMALKQMQHHLTGPAGGAIKRRGGGIAKRGMGIAK